MPAPPRALRRRTRRRRSGRPNVFPRTASNDGSLLRPAPARATSPKRGPCSPSATATKSSGEAYQLIEDINEAHELGTLRKLRARLRGADLLFIDDSFLRKLPARDDDELADVLMSHCEIGRDDHCEARISRPRPHPSHRAGVEELDLPTGRGVRAGRPAQRRPVRSRHSDQGRRGVAEGDFHARLGLQSPADSPCRRALAGRYSSAPPKLPTRPRTYAPRHSMARDLRRLTAIVTADATNHSRLMRRDAERTESLLRGPIDPMIARTGGRRSPCPIIRSPPPTPPNPG